MRSERLVLAVWIGEQAGENAVRKALGGLILVGTLFGGYASAESPATQPAGVAFALAGVDVVDMQKAAAFYTGVLGMRRIFSSGRPGDAVQEVGLGFGPPGARETMVVLIHHADGAPPLHPAKLVFQVPDARAMIERVRAAGYPVVSEPHGGAGAPITTAMARDAEGTLIEFFQLPAAR